MPDKYEIPETPPNVKQKKPPYKEERNTPFGIKDEYRPAANVKNLIKQFADGRLIYRGRYVRAEINQINRTNNTFRIDNAKLDDKHVFIVSNDFDIYIKGIKVSSDIYTVAQSGEDVIITFTPGELDYDTFCAADVIVFGKFTEVNINEVTTYLLTEEINYLITEDNKLLII